MKIFKRNDKVKCIDDSPNPLTDEYMPNRPRLNEIYTVRSITNEIRQGDYGIRLYELKNPVIEWGDNTELEWAFRSSRFEAI